MGRDGRQVWIPRPLQLSTIAYWKHLTQKSTPNPKDFRWTMYAECPSLSDMRFDQIYGGTGTIINETKCAKNRLAYSFLVSSFWGNGLVSMNYGIWFWNYFLRSKIITYSLIIIWKLIWWILKYEKLTINSHLNILLNCCYNLLLSFTTSKNTQSSEKTPSYRYCYVRN